MNEEEEFGMNKTSRDADPMEQEGKSAVKDHPDFNFLDAGEIHAAISSGEKRAVPTWMTNLPVEKDPSKWTILEVQIRPDRAWEVIEELIATVCIGKGLVVAESYPNAVLFRKKVTQESVAHGMANSATYQNVFVRIGVSPSKLRVVDICYLVSDESKLLGGIMSTSRPAPWLAQEHNRSLVYALDQLLGALQSTLLSQCLSLSHLYMATPENSMDAVENAELDAGYIADLKKAFSSEMKANMRDLCIPLESYAYEQEFACAMLIGLLEPALKKYRIKLTDSPAGDAGAERATSAIDATADGVQEPPIAKEAAALTEEKVEAVPSESLDASTASNQAISETTGQKIYGEAVTELVQELWRKCKTDCEAKLRAKIEEKQQQVTARVEAVQDLRARAIRAIMDADNAEASSLKTSTPGDGTNVLLYEASCVINGMPVTLHVTYGALIYRTMVPLFATTTVVPFDDVVSVAQTTLFGIQVLAVVLDPAKHPKGMTIAMGLEVDLIYQLLSEISSMHKREAKEAVTAKNAVELEKILSSEKEEEKEDEGLARAAAPSSTNGSKVAAGGSSDEQEGGNA